MLKKLKAHLKKFTLSMFSSSMVENEEQLMG